MREFLREHTLSRDEVDYFLDPKNPNWAVFHPERGYELRSAFVQDGIDGTYTIGTFAETGERRMVNYADKPCRINCYGDSYTQCQQVSDGETWEEYLAGHLGEPVRNFGVGGYGVYQAYLRMRHIETGASGTPYVILNIFGVDDHYRSLDAWRRPRCGNWFKERGPTMFHANPWNHVRIDPETGDLVERPNLLPTPESLYRLCDEETVYETFKDDVVLNMYLGQQPGTSVSLEPIAALASALDLEFDLSNPENRHQAIRDVYWNCAMRSTMKILQMARSFAEARHKQLLVLLSFGMGEIVQACADGSRADGALLTFLNEEGFLYVDTLAAHRDDFRKFQLSPEEYVRRYCIGHYNPTGNHFFAYAIKDAVVNWLVPKPLVYQGQGETMRFDDYLVDITRI